MEWLSATWLHWGALALICLIFQAFFVDLLPLWFFFGALAAGVGAYLGQPLLIQVLLMLGVSSSMVLIYLLLRKKLGLDQRVMERTNADRVLGAQGYVVETITNVPRAGVVEVLGQTWSAISADGKPIPKGQAVEVLRFEGIRVVVSPLP